MAIMYTRVYPTGTVRYNPEKCWNGLTIVPCKSTFDLGRGATLYDMNGNVVNSWPGLWGCFDNKMLPGGDILGTTHYVEGYWHDCRTLTQRNWKGETVWEFDRGEEITDYADKKKIWSARVHHDFQRKGSPTGYYCPGQNPAPRGISLINSNRSRSIPEISEKHLFCDTLLIEVDEKGKIIWEWSLYDHWDELGLEFNAKAVLKANNQPRGESGELKDVYCNCISYVGPNKWYDAGDKRFHPDNLITDIRALNVSFIIDHETGRVVWRMGPNFACTKELQDIGQIVGQHHFHMIPQGLPGAGNVLIFDNGGQAGMGAPSACAPSGYNNATRSYSRVLEIDPTTMKVVWAYNNPAPGEFDFGKMNWGQRLFSAYCSSADRLPNGNTLITESIGGRVIEVTVEGEIVWEFYNPGHHLFRAHRYPYDWFPLDKKPQEIAINPPLNMQMRITPDGQVKVLPIEEVDQYYFSEGRPDRKE